MELYKSLVAIAAVVALTTSCSDSPTTPDKPVTVVPKVTTGTVKVTVATSGADLDDLYWLSVGSERAQIVRNGTFTVKVTPGAATVELTDVASNCLVAEPSPVSVTVARADSVTVAFHVTCYQAGFQITVRTSGNDLPPNYTLEMSGRAPMPVPFNSGTLITRVEPGTYTFRLQSPLESCAVRTGEVRIDLPPRTVVPVTFEVACATIFRPESIAYTIDSTSKGKLTSYVAVARPDGTQERVIGIGSSPSWSPDGTRLAYAVVDCSDDYYYALYGCTTSVRVVDPETLREINAYSGDMPALSPAGDRVAMVWLNGLLAVANADGGNSSPMPGIPKNLIASDPAWSPDATRIAFACRTVAVVELMCVVNSDGTGFRELTNVTSVFYPAWSRDGGTIALTHTTDGRREIATMAASGGAITTLTDGFDPSWSTDGTKLIFARADGLFTMNPDGTSVQRLTMGKHRAPAWRP